LHAQATYDPQRDDSNRSTVEYAADSQRLNKTVAGGFDKNIHVFDDPKSNFRREPLCGFSEH
jgi:hypothetical protein